MLNRRQTLIAFLVAALAVSLVLPALAEDKAPETAAFAVPNLTDAAVVKNLTDGLAKVKGVVAAKADAAAGKFLVTFNPGKTNPEKLTAAITKLAPEAKLEGVTAADGKAADHSACGACPHKSSCDKKK